MKEKVLYQIPTKYLIFHGKKSAKQIYDKSYDKTTWYGELSCQDAMLDRGGTMEEFNDFEAILAIKASDWADSHESNPIYKEKFKPKHVVVVSAENLRSQLPNDDYISFRCEDRNMEE